MSVNRVRLILTGACLLLVLIVLGFSTWLNIASFKKNYVSSLVAGYTVAGSECRRNIEYAVKYGKPLANFYGMKELLREVKENAPDIEDVGLILPDGNFAYDLEGAVKNKTVPPKIKSKVDFNSAAADLAYVTERYEGKYYLFLPVRDRDSEWIGSLSLVFDESIVDSRSSEYMRRNLRAMFMAAVIAAVLLTIALLAFPVVSESGQVRKKRLLPLLLAIIIAAQVYYGVNNISLFKKVYFEAATNNTLLTAKIIQKDVQQVLRKGLSYSRLTGVEDWLGRTMTAVPEIERIFIRDTAGSVLYQASSHGTADDGPDSNREYMYSLPLEQDRTGMAGSIDIMLSKAYFDSKITAIKLDLLTVLATSFFFTIELIMFLLLLMNLQAVKISNGAAINAETRSGGNPGIIRPLAFIFYMATDLSISFIPMHMKSLSYQPLLGLPPNVVLGLPISVEMLCASITAIFTGYVVDRRGWRFPFFAGLLFLMAGALLSGLAGSALLFILARGVVGVGYGFSWMAMRGYVAAHPTDTARAQGFSQLNAGLYAANICACVLGAMLAERLGFSTVFFIALAVLMLAGIFAVTLVKDPAVLISTEAAKPALPAARGNLAAFLGNYQVLSLFLLITIPSTICLTGFLNYFFPLYSNSIGVSPSNVGRAFMIYGVCIVYLGPVFGRLIGRNVDIRRFIILASCIGATAMLLFFSWGGLAAAIVAIFMLGLADSIGFVSQNTYFLTIEATRALGEGKALGLFSMAKKIGQMLGPLTFGWLVAAGPQQGAGLIGVTYLAVILLYYLGSRVRPDATSFNER